MSLIADNRAVINVLNQTTTTGVILDLSTIDLISLSATYAPVGGGTGTLAVYESVDGTNFIAVSGLTVSITMAGTTLWHINPVFSRYYKILYTASTFGMNLTVTMNARNNADYDDVTVVPPPSVVNS
jgi:hypothetical protein